MLNLILRQEFARVPVCAGAFDVALNARYASDRGIFDFLPSAPAPGRHLAVCAIRSAIGPSASVGRRGQHRQHLVDVGLGVVGRDLEADLFLAPRHHGVG